MKQQHPQSQTTAILYQHPTKEEMTSPKPSIGKGAMFICVFIIVATITFWSFN